MSFEEYCDRDNDEPVYSPSRGFLGCAPKGHGPVWTNMTQQQCYEFEAAGAKMSAALAVGAAVLALFSGPAAAIVVAVAGIMYLQSEMGHLRCSFTYF